MADDATTYEQLLEAEQAFLANVQDEDIRTAYLAAKGGDTAPFKQLTEIAMWRLVNNSHAPSEGRSSTLPDLLDADMQPLKGGTLMLTLDMRMDIIRQQYAKEFPGQQLQSDIAREIAELLPDASGGELEGTLTRIVAYASLTDQEVSVPLVRDVLNKMTGEERL
jgi:hypothetical protein